ncbi:MAG: hypothetical protein RLZZ204_461 [Bacteroidota bacterium]
MKPFRPVKLVNFFLQGMIILAPIVITAWAVLSLFNFVDGILPNLLHLLFPDFVKLNPQGDPEKIPGLGFLVVVLIVLLVGYISSLFFVSKLVDFFGSVFEKTPGIKIIYTTVKDFLEAFAGNKRKFNKPVLVNVDATDVWRIGFITQKDLTHFDMREHVCVYVPHSYAFSGITFFVKQDRIKIIKDIHSTDVMKFIVSGGVTDVVEEKREKN